MRDTPFIITIDTEGDNLWSRPREITTHNVRFLPRFQFLCERYGFRPVYLADYEMAICDEFVEFGRDIIARDTGEIGMHLHAWNSPPLVPLTNDDFRNQPYLMEYSDDVMREKIRFLTALLHEQFGVPIVSHRAGRLGLDGRYAAVLLEEGYRVDCSVTPGIDWSTTLGAPGGCGGPNYRRFPNRPYFLSPNDISAPSNGGLLEVPVTVQASYLSRKAPWAYRLPLVGRIARSVQPEHSWLYPAESSIAGMRRAALGAQTDRASCIELMLHSSELMPAGSPTFHSSELVEWLYNDLETLFEQLARSCRGMTLAEFHAGLTTRVEGTA